MSIFKKTTTICKNGKGFSLFKVPSHRVNGLPYPKDSQDFFDEKEGSIKKSKVTSSNSLDWL